MYYQGVACTSPSQGRPDIPWLYKFLQEIYLQLLRTVCTTYLVDQEEPHLVLDSGVSEHLQYAEKNLYYSPNLSSLGPRSTYHGRNGCLRPCLGHYLVYSRWRRYPSSHLLFQNVQPSRIKL